MAGADGLGLATMVHPLLSSMEAASSRISAFLRFMIEYLSLWTSSAAAHSWGTIFPSAL
jgi:hypothetical protein